MNTHHTRAIMLAGSMAILALHGPAFAAQADYYLKIPDIEGESEAMKPGVEPDEIDNKVAGSSRFSGGVRVASGDVTGDGKDAPPSGPPYLDVNGDNGAAGRMGPMRWMAPEALRSPSDDGVVVLWAETRPVPRDHASGMATGKRQHKPFVITKELDAAEGGATAVDAAKRPGRAKFSNITLKRGMIDSTGARAGQLPTPNYGPVITIKPKGDETGGPDSVAAPDGKPQQAGLLLPAVQSARVSSEQGTHGSSQATGRRTYNPIVIRKRIDKSSPLVAPDEKGPGNVTIGTAVDSCEAGGHLPMMVLGQQGGRELVLHGVTVVGCTAEEISFNYAKVEG